MSKRWLIVVSVGIHVGIAIGLFVSGVWHIERLEGAKPNLALGVMIPGEDPGGGGEPGHKPADPKPPKDTPKAKVRDPRQPPDHLKTDDKPAEETSASIEGNGSGDGTGSGVGSGSGEGPPGIGTGSGEGPPCLPGDPCGTPPPPAPVAVVKTALVPPNVLAGLRTSGETQIMPSDPVKTEMMRDGRDATMGSFKVCIDASGRISSVAIAGSTKYSAYDSLIVSKIREWRYQPYRVDNMPVPACSVVTFKYSMH